MEVVNEQVPGDPHSRGGLLTSASCCRILGALEHPPAPVGCSLLKVGSGELYWNAFPTGGCFSKLLKKWTQISIIPYILASTILWCVSGTRIWVLQGSGRLKNCSQSSVFLLTAWFSLAVLDGNIFWALQWMFERKPYNCCSLVLLLNHSFPQTLQRFLIGKT